MDDLVAEAQKVHAWADTRVKGPPRNPLVLKVMAALYYLGHAYACTFETLELEVGPSSEVGSGHSGQAL